jgi:hypothetical protein
MFFLLSKFRLVVRSLLSAALILENSLLSAALNIEKKLKKLKFRNFAKIKL